MENTAYPFSGEPAVKKRILIVDDIRTDLHYMGKLISGFGHETILAESGASALEMIDADTDLIIADGIMPGMDGFALVSAIRTNPFIAHIPVIMVTSLSGREERIKAVEVGINDFITKPVDKVELKVRVHSMLKMKDAQDRVKRYQKELEYLVEKKTWALNSALQKLQAILNGMSDCMIALNPRLEIIEVNQAFVKVCGKSLEELRGKPFHLLLKGDEQIRSFEELFSGETATCERDMEFPQWGRRVFSLLVTHMKDNLHILVMRDVTEKKQANEQKARFLSILSHELRTPLNGIKGFAEVMLNDSGDLSLDHRDYLSLIHDCGCQLEAIVNELLRFVQFYNTTEDPQETDLCLEHLARQVLETFDEKILARNIHASLSLEGPRPMIHGRHEHLFEVFRQIIANAVTFSPDGGDIDLVLKTLPDTVLFICRDQGQGIPDYALDRVFDSFFQAEEYTTRTRNGLGLGLTICRKIVEMYQGTIRIANRKNGGTRVEVTLQRPR